MLSAMGADVHRGAVAWLARRKLVDASAAEDASQEPRAQTSLEACAAIAAQRGAVGALRDDPDAKPEGDGRVETSPRSEGAVEIEGFNLHATPNVLSVKHWERLLGGALYAATPRLDWASLLRRSFQVDVLECARCGGRLRVLGEVTDPAMVRLVLESLGMPTEAPLVARAPCCEVQPPVANRSFATEEIRVAGGGSVVADGSRHTCSPSAKENRSMKPRSIKLPVLVSLAVLSAAVGCSTSPPESVQSTASADTGSSQGGFLTFGGQYGYGKCFDVEGDNIGEAANLDSANCNGTQAQSFIIDGTQIHPAQNRGYCLDLQNANYTPGVWVQLWPCNGLPNQQWLLQNGTIVSQGAQQAGKSLCLDVLNNNASSGAVIGMNTCNGSVEQLFFPFGYTVELQSTEITGGLHECMDVWQDKTTLAGQAVDDYTCDVNSDRNDAQEFTFTARGQITNHGLCLGWVPGGYNPLQMQACTGQVQQYWQYAPGPSGTLNIQNAGGFFKCLDVPGNNSAPGTVMDMTVCNNSTEQEWTPVITGTPCGAPGEYCCVNPAQSQCNSGATCEKNTCVPCGSLGKMACQPGNSCQSGLSPNGSGVCVPPAPPPPPAELTFPVSGSTSNFWTTFTFNTTVTVYPNGNVTWAPEMSNSSAVAGYCYTLYISFPGYSNLLVLNGIVGVGDTTFPPGPGPSAAASAWVKANYLGLQGAKLGWQINIESYSGGSPLQTCQNWWNGGDSGSTQGSAASVCNGGGTYQGYPVCCYDGSTGEYSSLRPLACTAQGAVDEAAVQNAGSYCQSGDCPSCIADPCDGNNPCCSGYVCSNGTCIVDTGL